MGNCQAIDAATIVIQHPNGKEEKLYWPVYAAELMKMNPGHYVVLLISTTLYPTNKTNNNNNNNNNNSVRLTRIKLLRPTDTLVLGQVYRLITTQEVMKGLQAKKYAKMKKNLTESAEKPGLGLETAGRSELHEDNQVIKQESQRPRTTATANSATARCRTWQPSLNSISESAS